MFIDCVVDAFEIGRGEDLWRFEVGDEEGVAWWRGLAECWEVGEVKREVW